MTNKSRRRERLLLRPALGYLRGRAFERVARQSRRQRKGREKDGNHNCRTRKRTQTFAAHRLLLIPCMAPAPPRDGDAPNRKLNLHDRTMPLPSTPHNHRHVTLTTAHASQQVRQAQSGQGQRTRFGNRDRVATERSRTRGRGRTGRTSSDWRPRRSSPPASPARRTKSTS